MITRKNWPLFFFSSEILLLLLYYCVGSNNLSTMLTLKKDSNILKNEISDLQKEIAELDRNIEAFSSDSFYREEIARIRLGMARPDEIIYYIDN